MKIHVVRMDQKPIENYRAIVVSENFINFLDISDNECVEILANDALDSFSIEKIPECIHGLVKKLRLGGTLVIGGTDIRLFAKAITNGAIGRGDASGMIDSLHSMATMSMVSPVIEKAGLKIINTSLGGVHFEIKAQRV